MRILTKYARYNRRNRTPSELHFYKILQREKIKFRTQRMIDIYIVDFLIPDKRLIIELDGSSHDNKEFYDKQRDDYLKSKGYIVMHYPNSRVYKNPESILSFIRSLPNKLPPSNWRDLYGRAKY